MSDDHTNAERLNDAIDALLDGRAPAEAALCCAPEEARLLRAATWLAGVRAGLGGGPRPTFVLALEEQLRADLRLLPPIARAGHLTGPLGRALVVLLVPLAVLLVGTARWQPPTVQRVDQRTAEPASLLPPGGDFAAPAALMGEGWRQLQRVRSLHETGAVTPAEVRRAVDEVVASFVAAIDAATAGGDARATARARSEAEAAARALATMGEEADRSGLAYAVWLGEGAAEIRQHLRPLEARQAAPEGSPTIPPTAAARASAAAPVTDAPPRATAVLTLPATPVTPTGAPSALPVLPSATWSPTAQVPLPPPDVPATRAPSPTPTGGALVPSPTPERTITPTPDNQWPATSTPRPPILPLETVTPPNPGPSAAASSPTPPAATAPTGPAGAGGSRAAHVPGTDRRAGGATAPPG